MLEKCGRFLFTTLFRNEIITHEYFRGDNNIKDHILTGAKLYNEIKSMLLGGESQRRMVEEFQRFLQENFSLNMIKFN